MQAQPPTQDDRTESAIARTGKPALCFIFLLCHVCPAQGQRVFASPEDLARIQSAAQGDIVVVPGLLGSRREAPKIPIMVRAKPGVQFLLSDKPEYFPKNGIALQEMVQPGVVRLYLYHVPSPAEESKTIVAMVKNPGASALRLKFLRRGVPAAGTDYQRMARTALRDFLSEPGVLPPDLVLRAGQAVLLDAQLETFSLHKNFLVHGFYEFQVDRAAQISVLQRDRGQGQENPAAELPLLRRSEANGGSFGGAGRGLFTSAEYEVTNSPNEILDTAQGPCQLIVADGKTDPWIRGHDTMADAPSLDVGNYGVIYHIRLARKSSDGRALALLLCKAGSNGRYCARLAAAIKISKGVFPAGTINLPASQPSFGDAGEVVLIQKFPPLAPGKIEVLEMTYSPPGAACIPTPLFFVPCDP